MIFWKYIKGLNEGTPAQAGDPIPQFFTFLKFSNTGSDYSCELLPEIYVNTSNSFGGTPLGKIITSDATNQTINKDFTFSDIRINFSNEIWDEDTGEKYSYLQYLPTDDHNIALVSRGDSGKINLWAMRNCIRSGNGTTGVTFTVASDNVRLYASNSETSYGSDYKFSLNNNGDIDTKGRCQAAYFNATSDRRAKINIKPLNLSALELIKRVPVCSFTYKDSDLPSIGIIAQDVQDIEIEGFKLVDNEQASGKDYDYMSIHESKLTYILWKAVQEQQKQIDLLKEEIEQLKKRG